MFESDRWCGLRTRLRSHVVLCRTAPVGGGGGGTRQTENVLVNA